MGGTDLFSLLWGVGCGMWDVGCGVMRVGEGEIKEIDKEIDKRDKARGTHVLSPSSKHFRAWIWK